MPDAKDYKRAMEKVTAGQRWKDDTLKKMQAETARPRRTIPFGRRAIPLATAAAICLLVIPAAVRGFSPVSTGSTAQDAAAPRMATARQMPESSATVAPFALEAEPEAGSDPDTTAVPAYTLVEADSPEAALPADTRPAEDAPGWEAALTILDETLAAEGEGRTRADVLASGLVSDGAFAVVLADPGEAGLYRVYLLAPTQ